MAPIVDCDILWWQFQYIKPEIRGHLVKHRLLDLVLDRSDDMCTERLFMKSVNFQRAGDPQKYNHKNTEFVAS